MDKPWYFWNSVLSGLGFRPKYSPGHRANRRRRQLTLEQLEARQMLTTVTLTSSVSVAVYHQAIALTATVPSGISGSIDFQDTISGVTTDLGTVAISSSVATLTTSNAAATTGHPLLAVGDHSITAEYLGDDSESSPVPVTVAASDPVDQATPSPVTDGSLVLPLSAAGLTYVSGSNGQPIVSIDAPIAATDGSGSGHALTGVTAELSIGGLTATTYYTADDLTNSAAASGTYRFAVKVPSALATGRYAYSMTITQTYADSTNSPATHDGAGNVKDVLNWNASPFGRGWNLAGLDALAPSTSGGPAGVSLVMSDGTMGFFSYADGVYTPTAGPFAFDALSGSWEEGFTLTSTDGTIESDTFDAFGDPTSLQESGGSTTVYKRDDNGLVTEMIQPSIANGASTVSPTTAFSYYHDSISGETLPDGTTESWDYTTISTTAGGQIDVPVSYTQTSNGVTSETVYTNDSGTGDPTQIEQYANGSSSYNTGQNTSVGGDPITTSVYTPDLGGGYTPAGLVASTTDPDGDVSASTYNAQGDAIATFAGQTRGPDSTDGTTWTYSGLALNRDRTYELYVKSSTDLTGTDEISGSDFSFTESGSGTVSLSFSVSSAATLLGAGWYDVGQVTVTSTSEGTALTLSYSGSPTVTEMTLLEPMSTSVYSAIDSTTSTGMGPDDLLSTTDPMGNISATSYDNLDEPTGTAQGQAVTATSNAATFQNLPQAPGLARTYEIYGYTSSTISNSFSISDAATSSASFSYSNVASATLGGNWRDLGTVTLLAGDASPSLTAHYTGSGTITQFAFLEKLSTTVYDPVGDVLAQYNALGEVTTNAYNDLEQQVQTSQGQIVPVVSGGGTLFGNLPQAPGQSRTYDIYVYSASTASSSLTIGDNGSNDTTFTSGSLSATTPLGAGWHWLGGFTLSSSDTATALDFTDVDSADTQICVVQQVAAATYTATGQVATSTNALGYVTAYSYDPLGDLVTKTDPKPTPDQANPVTTLVYDADGNLTADFDPMGNVTAYVNQYGNGSSSTLGSTDNPYGTDTLQTWQGQSVSPDTSSGGSWTFNNLPLGDDVSGGSSVDRVYNVYADTEWSSGGYSVNDGTLSTAVPPALPASVLGSGWSWVGTVTMSGSDTTTSLSVSGHDGTVNVCLMQMTSSSTTDANGNVVSTSDALGNTTAYSYNPLGEANQQSIGSGPELGPLYDKAGNVISDTDLQNGAVTTYQYSMLGQQYETIQPLSPSAFGGETAVTTLNFDADGQLLSEIDPNFNSTSAVYNAFGDTVSTSLPDPSTGAAGGPTTTYIDDLDGRVISQTTPSDAFTYGSGGSTDTASTATTAYAYDADGNEISQSLPDPANGLQDSGSPTTTFTYDTMGDTLSLTDPDYNTTYWSYNGLGLEASQSEVVALGYNSDGTVNATTATSTDSYDLDGNLSQSIDADGRVITYSYDSQNREVGEIWYSSATALADESPTSAVYFSFDVLGNTTAAMNAAAAEAFNYDAAGNLTAQQIQLTSQTGGSLPSVALLSAFDYNGNRTSLKADFQPTFYASGGALSIGPISVSASGGIYDFQNAYTYNLSGEMTSVAQTAQTSDATIAASGGSADGVYYNGVTSKSAGFAYDPAGLLRAATYSQPTGSEPVAVAISSYDHDSRPSGIDDFFSTGGSSYTPDEIQYGFTYDNAGLLANATYTNSVDTTDFNSSSAFTYDFDGQLATAAGTGSSESSINYVNGPNGNRVTAVDFGMSGGSVGSGGTSGFSTNRLLIGNGNGFYYTYDAVGNRTAKFNSDTGALDSTAWNITIYGWDNANELVSVKTFATYSDYTSYLASEELPASEVDYTYDPFHLMVSRTVMDSSGDVTSNENYINDGQNVALVLNSTGQVTERELYGPAVDQVLASEVVTAGSSGATQAAGTVNWLLADNQGSVRDVLQVTSGTSAGISTTTEVDHLNYDPYGTIVYQSNSAAQPRFTYTGRQLDPLTGMQYNRRRWYDPVNGDWLGPDPIGFNAGQTNVEEYAGNDPVNGTDPSGCATVPLDASGAAAAVKAALIDASDFNASTDGSYPTAVSFVSNASDYLKDSANLMITPDKIDVWPNGQGMNARRLPISDYNEALAFLDRATNGKIPANLASSTGNTGKNTPIRSIAVLSFSGHHRFKYQGINVGKSIADLTARPVGIKSGGGGSGGGTPTKDPWTGYYIDPSNVADFIKKFKALNWAKSKKKGYRPLVILNTCNLGIDAQLANSVAQQIADGLNVDVLTMGGFGYGSFSGSINHIKPPAVTALDTDAGAYQGHSYFEGLGNSGADGAALAAALKSANISDSQNDSFFLTSPNNAGN